MMVLFKETEDECYAIIYLPVQENRGKHFVAIEMRNHEFSLGKSCCLMR